MPSPTRPGVIPIWTVGNTGARVQPTNGEQFAGFVGNFRPPAEWHNWLFGEMSDWIAWLDYATQGNGPVSNVGHNILTGTTVQQQLDETDAFLSSLGLKSVGITVTGNPLVYNLASIPLNGSNPIVFLDGVEQIFGTDFTFAIVLGTAQVTFAVNPAPQVVTCYILTANNPGSGGVSVSGGFVAYGNAGAPVNVTTAGITATSDQRQLWYVQGFNGVVAAPIIVTANPQITPGTKVGQEMRLVGAGGANTVQFNNGNGLFTNGPITLAANQSIDFEWDGLVWRESDRSN